ncbi:hypothetical protein NON08_12810 [Cetobacterium somerae]|uniref:hypothetical protein n=1 Tax=Cetobacterium sp. NK01 TaxID=2993530 RepID=UPI0021169D82|nr:hypothetical protein [Cetobacterium sp. NK01]MCQ8213382.1 hypothetical protein [Cetobacterium sp. NK01]
MRKKLLGICLLAFLIGCKGEESKTQELKQENKVNQVSETKVSKTIFNEKSLNELKKVQERLKLLYNYSTELRYEFLYDNTAIGISEENSYWFRTLSKKNSLFSVISIDLNNIKPYIYLSTPYNSIEIEYEQYLKIIEKFVEIRDSLYAFEPIRDMEVVIFDNILVNSKETKITLFLPKKGGNLIQFINKEDEKEIFNIKLEDTYDLEKNNNLESVNNIVLNYTPKFLEDVINLSQLYKKLDYIVKNSKEISTPQKESSQYSTIDLDWVNSEESGVTYYASGRVKTLGLITGGYEFEDKSNIPMIKENMNLLKETLKENNIEENIKMIVGLENLITVSLNVDESNLNITPEEKKELKKLRQEATELSKEVEKKLKSIN